MHKEEQAGSRRPARGRPPGPPDRVRPHRLVTFVTRAEMAQLREICDDEGKSLSALTHEILSRALRRRERAGGPVSHTGGQDEQA